MPNLWWWLGFDFSTVSHPIFAPQEEQERAER